MARTALVTGAAAGIGRACAKRLAKEGHAVGVLDLDLAKAQLVVDEIEAEGGKAIALEASVANRQQVSAAVAKLRDAFGSVGIVVNNAGVTHFKKFADTDETDWDFVYDVNVKGVAICTQAVLDDMIEAGWGRVINISSSSAQTGAIGMAVYSSSKGAIVTLTRSLAQELGPHGITVNNIPPGAVMNTLMSEANKDKFQIPMETLLQTIPVRRTGEPEDIAHACAFLAAEEAGYINGQTIGVNGGRVVS